MPGTPFDSIEGSHRYIVLLLEAVEEAQDEIESQIGLSQAERAARRTEALQLVAFNLTKLNSHITASRRILNDLRTLQRLLADDPETLSVTAGE